MKSGDGLYEIDPNNRNKYIFPDQLNFQKEPFATVIPYRSTTFKVHKTEGLANSALSHHGCGAKYKQENGVWVKIWEFYEPEVCENCDAVLTDRDSVNHYYRHGHDKWLRSPLYKGSKIFAPFLCRACYDREDEVVTERQKARQWRAEQKRREEFDAQLRK